MKFNPTSVDVKVRFVRAYLKMLNSMNKWTMNN